MIRPFRTYLRKSRVIYLIILIVALGTMGCQEKVITSGKCGIWGGNLTWQFSEDGVLTIKGNGPMNNYSWQNFRSPPWIHKCNVINKVIIENGVNTIGGNAFADCTVLTTVQIPESITEISSGAFMNCRNLESLIFPNMLNRIGSGVIQNCGSLFELTIPSSVSIIDEYAFINNSLSDIFVEEQNTHFSSVNGVLYNKLHDILICCPTEKKEIEIPKTVAIIREYAFHNCTHLSSIEIPNSVTIIESGTFWGCSNLSSVIIGSCVERIENYAFRDTYNLKSIICKSIIPPSIIIDTMPTFSNISKEITIYVPSGTLSAYQNSNWGKVFSNFIEE